MFKIFNVINNDQTEIQKLKFKTELLEKVRDRSYRLDKKNEQNEKLNHFDIYSDDDSNDSNDDSHDDSNNLYKNNIENILKYNRDHNNKLDMCFIGFVITGWWFLYFISTKI
jgi:hypothetical protein